MPRTRPFPSALTVLAAGILAGTTTFAQDLPADLVESHVFFPAGGTELDATAAEQVARLARVLETSLMADACLKLVGHADTSGPADVNEAVAFDRAAAVAEALGAALAMPERIEVVASAGETEPLPQIPATDPRQRRVAILARHCPEWMP